MSGLRYTYKFYLNMLCVSLMWVMYVLSGGFVVACNKVNNNATKDGGELTDTNKPITTPKTDNQLTDNHCGLIVNFAETEHVSDRIKANGDHVLESYSTMYVIYNDNIDLRKFKGYVQKLSRGHFVEYVNKIVKSKESIRFKSYDAESGDGWYDDEKSVEQEWRTIVVHPLWDGARDEVLFEREKELVTPLKDVNKQKYLRDNYRDIPLTTIPLKDEPGFKNSDFYFADNRYILSMYDNVVNCYDGFMYANVERTCFYQDESNRDSKCSNSSCISYATTIILNVDDNNQIRIDKHRSDVPEFYDGTLFKPVFKNLTAMLSYEGLITRKASARPLGEDGTNVSETSLYDRFYSFSPYATNISFDDEDDAYFGVSIVSPQKYSEGNVINECNHSYYDSYRWGWGQEIGNQSLIWGIPYEKAPDTVKPIIDRITHAPSGCGEIDWKKQELVFGDRRFPAPWLKEDIAGIYWLEPGEEFPIDRLVPDITVEYIDWDK